ncbi:MAG: hypothetical protein WCD89_13570 [Anaerocolumna sp.]
MSYSEYKKIISDALREYCNNGGSLLNIAHNKIKKEYIYEFDAAYPEDMKKNLIDKAHQAMQKGKELPDGIQLTKVIFRK